MAPLVATVAMGVSPRLLRRWRGFAAGFFAGALQHVFPLGRRVVGLGLAGARVRAVGGRAIVLASLGDAIALFLRRILIDSGGGGADGGQGGGDQGLTFVHGESPGMDG